MFGIGQSSRTIQVGFTLHLFITFFNSLYQDSKNNLVPYTFLIPDNYSFNLGDGTITLESNQTALNVWQTIEILLEKQRPTMIENTSKRWKKYWAIIKQLKTNKNMINNKQIFIKI